MPYELKARRLMQEEKQTGICKHCGSTRFSPSWPGFFGWLRPDVVVFVFKLILARVIAPWADKRAQWLLPRIERIVAYDKLAVGGRDGQLRQSGE